MRIVKRTILVLLIGGMFFTSCSNYKSSNSINVFPPESTFVKQDGSVPPGFWSAIKASGITPDCITCNSQNRYGSLLKSSADDSAVKLRNKLLPFLKNLEIGEKKHLMDELEDHIMWAMVRGVLIEGDNNNFGVHVLKGRFWTDSNGVKHPLVIFRTAFTPSPKRDGSCFKSILNCADVKHVINLYDGEMELDDLIKEERETSALLGASYVRTAELGYGHWRAAIRENPKMNEKREKAMKDLARLINEQILMPGGEMPKGNILIHCGGGMHRTGMVIGILQKVINGASMEEIKNTYSYHVGYKDKQNPGGFEQGNLNFIAEFPAELLLK